MRRNIESDNYYSFQNRTEMYPGGPPYPPSLVPPPPRVRWCSARSSWRRNFSPASGRWESGPTGTGPDLSWGSGKFERYSLCCPLDNFIIFRHEERYKVVDRATAGWWFREYCSNLKRVRGEQQPHHHSYRSRSPRLSQREWEEKQKAKNKKRDTLKETFGYCIIS